MSKLLTSLIPVIVFASWEANAQTIEFGARLSSAAIERTHHRVIYDSTYVRLPYPMGDVANDRGVCSDVVVRSLRALGLDLQQLVHEDMSIEFSAYPNHWGLTRPDANIDHRRVPNLESFFTRRGIHLSLSRDPRNFKAGDIVSWNLKGDSGWLPHIGIVTDQIAPSGRPMLVHNIGAGPKLEDVLFNWKMTGHFRVTSSDELLGE